ncbi:MAG: hypothetical protein ACYCW6_21100 [Candidatus Xenobia bacterium]
MKLRFIVAAILLLGLGLRLYHLGTPSFWLDEAYQVSISSSDFSTQWNVAQHYDPHPPLFHFLVSFWLRGWQHLTAHWNGEAEARSISVLFGLLCIYATWRMGRDMVGERGALWGAALLAASGFIMPFDQEVRLYPLLDLLSVLSVWRFWQLVHRAEGPKRPGMPGDLLALTAGPQTSEAPGRPGRFAQRRIAAEFVLFTVVGFYTDTRMIIVLAGEALWFWLVRRRYVERTRAAVGSGLACVLLLLPWLPTMLRLMGPEGIGIDLARMYVPPRLADVLSCPGLLFGGYTTGWPEPLEVLLGIAVLVLVLTAARFSEGAACLTAVMLTVIGGPVAAWYLAHVHMFSVKYCTPAVPLLMLLAGATLAGVRVPARAALLLLFLAPNACSLMHWYTDPAYQKQNWRPAMAFLKSQAQPGDVAYISCPIMDYPARYYLGSNPPLEGLVPWKLPQETSEMLQHPRFWLILCNDQLLDPHFKIRAWAHQMQASGRIEVAGEDFPNLFDPRTGGDIAVFLCRVR